MIEKHGSIAATLVKGNFPPLQAFAFPAIYGSHAWSRVMSYTCAVGGAVLHSSFEPCSGGSVVDVSYFGYQVDAPGVAVAGILTELKKFEK